MCSSDLNEINWGQTPIKFRTLGRNCRQGSDPTLQFLQTQVFLPKGVAVFDVLGVQGDAGHWADLHALGLVEMADTFGAAFRVDLINLLAQENRLVGTFGFADIAIDALVGDHQGHGVIIARCGPPCSACGQAEVVW